MLYVNCYSLNLFLYYMDADCYIAPTSFARKATNGMSLTAFVHGNIQNYSN